MRKRTVLTISGVTAAVVVGLLVYNATQKEAKVQPPFVGMGGSCRPKYPYNLTINSFREWDHYHEPGTGEPNTRPSHRFWTWAKLDRPKETPVWDCMGGTNNNPDHTIIDNIFECDKPIIDEMVSKYPGAIHGIGNEPNLWPTISAANYAYQFNKYEQYIRGIDPDAKLMTGGITLPVPWETWTNAFIAALSGYSTPFPDIWAIHPYPNTGLFPSDGAAAAASSIAHMVYFRDYLDTALSSDLPLLIGEFSDACGLSPVAQLVIYAEDVCDWLVANKADNRIVGWYWWGCSSVHMGNAGLFDADRNITLVGEAYIAHCGKYEYKINLPLIIKRN